MSVMARAKSSGYDTGRATQEMMQKAKAAEAQMPVAEQCIHQVSTNASADIQRLRSGTYNFNGSSSIGQNCAAVYVLNYYMMVATKETALAMACHAAAGR